MRRLSISRKMNAAFSGILREMLLALRDREPRTSYKIRQFVINFQVSLQYTRSTSHFCGGAVLNAYYVITVAHCVAE